MQKARSEIPNEQSIRDFWNAHPCGDHQVDSLKADYQAFFDRYDQYRYSREGHILRRLDAIDFKGKRVLEIGLGQGADAEQIIRRGALWSGLDLTPESVERVSARMRVRGLAFERIECGSALSMPFADHTFDIVFSHGVLHHIPDIHTAQREIARVLKPNGRLIAMLYARRSLNYLVSISLIRRAALLGLYLTGAKSSGIVGGHLANARKEGLWNYLKMPNFIHRNTDGPDNPYAKVYDLDIVRKDFPDFEIERTYQDHMHAPPLPVGMLKPLAGLLGWHLWVHLKPRK
ncbi:MAG TPA: class I SAM-dependent methyltransferase [Terriglobales bacterium]